MLNVNSTMNLHWVKDYHKVISNIQIILVPVWFCSTYFCTGDTFTSYSCLLYELSKRVYRISLVLFYVFLNLKKTLQGKHFKPPKYFSQCLKDYKLSQNNIFLHYGVLQTGNLSEFWSSVIRPGSKGILLFRLLSVFSTVLQAGAACWMNRCHFVLQWDRYVWAHWGSAQVHNSQLKAFEEKW